jgi:CRP/FNR family transcriptional regulator, cyclic AMP receptor protein
MDGGSSMDASTLAKLPGWGKLFSELPDRQRDDLAGRFRRRRYARGEAVFIKGDEGNSLYIIESGRVHIKLTSEDGREVVLNSLGPGDFFGDLALFDGEPRSADAVAVEGSHLVLLERRDFLRFLSDYPSAAVTLLAVLSRRLRRNAPQPSSDAPNASEEVRQ